MSTSNALNEVTSYVYDGNGNVTKTVAPKGNAKTTAFDAMDRAITSTDALGNSSSVVYDGVGNVIKEINPLGKAVSNEYDAKGRLVSFTDQLGKVTAFAYDGAGNKLQEVDANNQVAKWEYDKLNRVTKEYDRLDNYIRYVYDGNGNKVKVIDALGKVTLSEYNANNQLTRLTNPDGSVTQYGYDLAGNKTMISNADANSATFYKYDANNRLIEEKDSLDKAVSYTYDAVGNILTKTDGSGVTTYEYDAVYRETKVSYPDSKIFQTAYDKNGNVLSTADDTSTTTYTYNENDLVIKKVSATGDSTQTIEYSYDAAYNITCIKANGFDANYIYNERNELVEVKDKNNNSIATYAYDNVGNESTAQYSIGFTANFRYNANDMLESMTNKMGDNTLNQFVYTYDANNRQTSKTDSKGTTHYKYSGAGYLTNITNPDSTTVEYTYDNVGNRLSTLDSSGTTTYSYNTENQLIELIRPDSSTVSFIYNDNGDMVTKDDSSTGSTTFAYNGEGRLANVTLPDSSTVSFTYDARGNRISKTTSSGIVKYIYDGDQLVAEADNNGNIIATYVFNDREVAISMTRAGVTYYYVFNGHGDVIALIDQNGVTCATYDYDAWGNIISETGNIENPYRYAGYLYDTELKLYFLKSRYYDPSIGRFLEKDRMKGVDENPLNRYAYVKNDPVNLIDPTGHFAEVGEFPSRSWFDGIPRRWASYSIKNLQIFLFERGFWGRNGRRLAIDGIYGTNSRFAHESYFLTRYTSMFLGFRKALPVISLQRALKSHGFDPGPIDGIYGLKTRSANEYYLDTIKRIPSGLTRYTQWRVPQPVPRPVPQPVPQPRPDDVTNKLMDAMRTHGKEAKAIREKIKVQVWESMGSNPNLYRYTLEVYRKVLWEFYLKVKTNESWDLKNQPGWKQYGDKNPALFRGEQITAEGMGNIHFGYVGRAIGLEEQLLRIGAGAYQQLMQEHEVEWIFRRTKTGRFAFGDHPADVPYIIKGFNIFNEDKRQGLI